CRADDGVGPRRLRPPARSGAGGRPATAARALWPRRSADFGGAAHTGLGGGARTQCRAAPSIGRARRRSLRPSARRLNPGKIMDHFHLRDVKFYAKDVPLARIADEVSTPVYVYSRATLERHARVFREGLAGVGPAHLAFAVKANPNLA